MAFTAISTSDIEAGDPVSQELWSLVKTNFDDLDSRVSTLETSLQNFLPVTFVVYGGHFLSSVTGVSYYRIPFDITLTDSRLYLPADGSSGTTTVDVQKSAAGGGSFSTIFSTKPTLTFGGGNHSVNQGTLSVTALSQGEILRFDVNSAQVGSSSIILYLHFEAQ